MHNLQKILQAWISFKEAVGVTTVHTEAEYGSAMAVIDAILCEIHDDESHPLAEVLDFLADRVRAYEDIHVRIPDADSTE